MSSEEDMVNSVQWVSVVVMSSGAVVQTSEMFG